MNLKNLPLGSAAPERVNAIIEIPKGTRTKYEYDPQLGIFRLDRVLYSSMFYPTAYGFLPSTLAADGDPVDILILISEPLDVGVMVEAWPIGLLKMRDEKGEDDKVLAVATHDRSYREIRELEHVAEDELRLIEHFFRTYKTLEHKDVLSQGWLGRSHAHLLIAQGRAEYDTHVKKP
ncbi:MAG TPA: inorganic diphosphatase [Terriglobales bacterium]|jgi:inorganic pyrophosphatase